MHAPFVLDLQVRDNPFSLTYNVATLELTTVDPP